MKRPLLFALLLSIAACDSAGPVVDVPLDTPGLPQVVASEKAELSSSVASSFALSLDQRGDAQSVRGISTGFNQYNPRVLFSSGLWVSGTQNGTLRTARPNGFGTTGPCGDGSAGVFHLFADTTYAAEGWPAAQGAPVDASGAPRVYGDEMLWTTTCQTPGGSGGLTRFDGLRTNVALFRYDHTPNTVFARYEITNTGGIPMSDVTVGLFADPDFSIDVGADIYDNLVGLDAALNLGYVYFDQIITQASPSTPGILRTAEQRGHVAGATLLQTPHGVGLTAHRIVRKVGLYEEPRTSEDLLHSRALQGIFNDGSLQIDWTTGRPDKLAYTGDPVAMTGWLDGTGPLQPAGADPAIQEGSEIRLLLASGPTTLAPGERATLTVAWATANEPSLGAGLDALRQRVSSVRASPALWTF